ncbi:FAD dependent oxidoreductase [Croceitalea dokdonensis DOKDO 023]|uniref:FAD dependent oxidoreductase n=1 Tax=Croceitalea dokdonensis DOKDO 023 TaxID=1300341 RepID=A0A0P7AX52_9FLAO|nr:FAD-binding oxidoreductase [Croceitalea dokdonensis]KPM32619.1 FAD dependent oxidoreductase [Croceitalea dokdonensis DOKDO 023]
MVDYLVVGLGLAGISFCEKLEAAGKSFMVIDDNSQRASAVAGGLYNPVILKRCTMAWKAREQMELAIPFYEGLERKLGVKLDYKLPVLRKFASVAEQNLWFEAAGKKDLDYYLSTKILANNNPHLNIPFGLGKVRYTGRIATKTLLKSYKTHLCQNKKYHGETFNFKAMVLDKDTVVYEGLRAKNLVFAEGYGMQQNPFFNYLPLNGTKGELLTVYAPELKAPNVVKSSVFIIPLGEDRYRVGATYKWKDKTNTPTEESKKELMEKLNSLITCTYEVEDHVAGVRPTVADRRPLVGRHPVHTNLYVLNGFGSRGVLIAPYAADQLLAFIEKGIPLDVEMDISRCTKKYFQG